MLFTTCPKTHLGTQWRFSKKKKLSRQIIAAQNNYIIYGPASSRVIPVPKSEASITCRKALATRFNCRKPVPRNVSIRVIEKSRKTIRGDKVWNELDAFQTDTEQENLDEKKLFKSLPGGSRHYLSDETRSKFVAFRTGLAHSDETKERISEAMRGKKKSEEMRRKVTQAAKGRKKSEEVKAKIASSLKGRVVSPQTRAKMALAAKRRAQKKQAAENALEPGNGKLQSIIQKSVQSEDGGGKRSRGRPKKEPVEGSPARKPSDVTTSSLPRSSDTSTSNERDNEKLVVGGRKLIDWSEKELKQLATVWGLPRRVGGVKKTKEITLPFCAHCAAELCRPISDKREFLHAAYSGVSLTPAELAQSQPHILESMEYDQWKVPELREKVRGKAAQLHIRLNAPKPDLFRALSIPAAETTDRQSKNKNADADVDAIPTSAAEPPLLHQPNKVARKVKKPIVSTSPQQKEIAVDMDEYWRLARLLRVRSRQLTTGQELSYDDVEVLRTSEPDVHEMFVQFIKLRDAIRSADG